MRERTPEPSPEWLVSLRLDLADIKATALANRQATQERIELLRDSVRRDIAWVLNHVDHRFAELLRHYERTERDHARLERELWQAAPPPESSETAKNLMAISRVVALLRRLPWRLIFIVLTGALAVLAHLLPVELNQVLRDYQVLPKSP